MKIKLLSVIIAASAALAANSQAVVLSLAGIANTTVGLITVDPDGAGATPYSAVSGRAIFVSTTDALVNVDTSMNALLSSSTTTSAQFDAALAALIGATSATDPGIVRNATFTNGLLSSTGSTEMGNVGNFTYLFLVSEVGGNVTGIGAYTGSAVPAAGSVTFNPAFAGDSLGVGTSVFASGTPNTGFQLAPAVAPVPEPSAALLGVIGALGLLRRRRN